VNIALEKYESLPMKELSLTAVNEGITRNSCNWMNFP